MAARTPKVAIETLVERLRPVVACVSEQPFGTASIRTGSASISFMPFGRPTRLRRPDGVSYIGFEARLDVTVARADSGFETTVAGYSIGIREPDGREILAFHWHPEGTSQVKHPHLHLTSRMPPIPLGRAGAVLSLAIAHIPTGEVSLADIIRMLIVEFGVEPRRSDWSSILATNLSSGSSI